MYLSFTWSRRAGADGFSAGNVGEKGKGHTERLCHSLDNQLTRLIRVCQGYIVCVLCFPRPVLLVRVCVCVLFDPLSSVSVHQHLSLEC